MSRLWIIFLSALLFSFAGVCQNSFNRVYTHNTLRSSTNGIVEDGFGNFIFVTDVFDWPSYVEVVKVNSFGDTLWTTQLRDTGYSTQSAAYGDGGIVLTSDSIIVIVGTRFGFNPVADQGYCCMLNTSGSILNFISFGGVNEYYFTSLIALHDGNLLITGDRSDTSTGDWDACVIKLNSNGTILWEQVYPKSTLDDNAWSATELNDYGILIGGHCYDSSMYYCYLIKTDSAGIKEWDKVWNDGLSSGITGVLQSANGNYILSGEGRTSGGTYSQGYVARFDNLGNVIWEKKYGASHLFFDNKPIEMSDGCILCSGSGYKDPTDGPYGAIMAVSDTGDSLWTRFDRFPGTVSPQNSQFYDFIKIKDGFIGVGYAHSPSQNSWVIKLDSTDIPSCNNILGVMDAGSSGESIQVFPNPFSEQLTFVNGSNKLSEVTIFDISGRKILRRLFTNTITIPTPYFEKGIYLYQIVNLKGECSFGKLVKD